MNNRTLFGFVIFLLSLSAQAQVQRSPQLFYGRYEGSIGDQLTLSVNLIRSFNQVSGNFQYETSGTKLIETLTLSGQAINDSTYLKEFGRKTTAFKSVLTSEQFSGVWTNHEEQSIGFVLNAKYPQGSMAFDVSYLHSEILLDPKDKNSPTAHIELTLIYPKTGYANPTVSDSVMKVIKSSFFGEGLASTHPDSLLMAFEQEYYRNYREQNQPRPETDGYSFSWEKMINTGVIYNSNHVLCLEFERYAYTGGAHGMSHISYRMVNLQDGSPLTFQDVFIEGSDSLLSQLLTQKLRDDFHIPEDSTLKKAGFFIDKIVPNHNLYINGNGIGFVYNSYEIAPYSFGATHIFLEFKQVDQLIKPTSPVYKLVHPVL
jgi:hypothetical protein